MADIPDKLMVVLPDLRVVMLSRPNTGKTVHKNGTHLRDAELLEIGSNFFCLHVLHFRALLC